MCIFDQVADTVHSHSPDDDDVDDVMVIRFENTFSALDTDSSMTEFRLLIGFIN